MSDFKLPIGIMIKGARVLRRLEQFDLQGLTGIHRSHISVIETGKFLPTPTQLQAIEAALGIRFSDPEVQAAFLILAGNSYAPDASAGNPTNGQPAETPSARTQAQEDSNA